MTLEREREANVQLRLHKVYPHRRAATFPKVCNDSSIYENFAADIPNSRGTVLFVVYTSESPLCISAILSEDNISNPTPASAAEDNYSRPLPHAIIFTIKFLIAINHENI